MMDLKSTPYWNIYADVFNLFKKSLPVRDDDPYWQQVVDDAEVIYRKYDQQDESEFAKREVMSVLNELEAIWKRKRGDRV